jgi:hypothetical protein
LTQARAVLVAVRMGRIQQRVSLAQRTEAAAAAVQVHSIFSQVLAVLAVVVL